MNIFHGDVYNFANECCLNYRITPTFIFMEACYQTLLTIYEIVKSDPFPHTYLVTPHEVILRQTEDWKSIEKHLEILSSERLVIIRQLDKVAISITLAGIAKVKALKNNFVNDNFQVPNILKRNITNSQ